MHAPQSFALGVLRGFPHCSHGGPYRDSQCKFDGSHRDLGLMRRLAAVRKREEEVALFIAAMKT